MKPVASRALSLLMFAALLALHSALTVLAPAHAATIERVSVSSTREQGNDWSSGPSVSADARFVAFLSKATNLVEGDTNGAWDVFVRDRLLGTTERVSVSTDGDEANGHSGCASINADGRFVAFYSDADNLVLDDTNGCRDVFVRDRTLGITSRVSVSDSSEQGNAASTLSSGKSISGDGRLVAFQSDAGNLVPGDTNTTRDVFVHDLQTGRTTRVSMSSSGVEADGSSQDGSISADGRYVAFGSAAGNLAAGAEIGGVFVHDRQTGVTEFIGCGSSTPEERWNARQTAISGDGRYIVFEMASYPGGWIECDTSELYVHDRQTRETVLVATAGGGSYWRCEYCSTLGAVAISAGGRFIAYPTQWWESCVEWSECAASVVVRDTAGSGSIPAVSTNDCWKYFCCPALSVDGRYVALASNLADLVAGDTNEAYDVFLLDRFPAPPETYISSYRPCGRATCSDTVTIQWYGTDGVATEPLNYSWRLDGGDWQPWSTGTRTTLSGLSEGPHVFEVKARDQMGNEDPTPADCKFAVDFTPPTVSITSPADGATVRGLVTIAAAGGGPIASVQFYVNGQWQWAGTPVTPPYSCEWNTTLEAVARAEVCAQAFDQCGWTARHCITVNLQTFDDVPPGHPAWLAIEAIARRGITSGCSTAPRLFCPYGQITRAQMAVFLCRAAGKGPLNRETPTFCDVPKDNPYYGWIERLADPDSWGDNPPTIGCTAFPCRQYCPWKSVTRDEMAAFLVRATAKQPMPSCSGLFADVAAYWACPYIERLVDTAPWPGGVAVTAGCATNPLRYCPKSAVTRGQMAVFLVRAFGIPL